MPLKPDTPTIYKIVDTISFDEYYLDSLKKHFKSTARFFVENEHPENFIYGVKRTLRKIETVITKVNSEIYSDIDKLNMIIILINQINGGDSIDEQPSD